MSRFSKKDNSKQETLTSKRLQKIAVGYRHKLDRPTDSLIQVVHWAREYIESITQHKDWVPFIHNKISIDGAFLQYCEESGYSLKAIHTDAITSWNTNDGDEHFVGIGIFEIKDINPGCNEWSFYHCGLFHKGNQNEDEVSFFIFIRPDDLERYRVVRNSFEDWQKKRDRNNQEIEVIGGSPIAYDVDVDWDTLFLPEDLKNRITTTIEGFLKSEDLYRRLKVSWRQGIGFWGPRGCGKTSFLRLLMSKYQDLKPVTIQPGHSSPDELLEEAFEYAEKHSPSLLFFEDLQELVKTIDLRHFLQLLDGLQKRDGILTVVTGNDFSDLQDNLKSRPRRFDRFFEFPLPDLNQCKKYLSKYFSDILSTKKIESIAKKAVKNKFTYAHLQEVYFNSVFIAIPEGREVPGEEDVNLSIKQVIEEKIAADSGFIENQRDLTDDIEYESEDL
jgi:hypothetical protein